jgi:hypothetical protein
MGVARAFAAALGRHDACRLPRLRAVRSVRALDALLLGATRGAPWLAALGVARTLDAGSARQIAHGQPRLAVGRPRTRSHTAASSGIAARAAAVRVRGTLHAAPVATITDALGALAVFGALHARARARLAMGLFGGAVDIRRALGTAPAAIAGGAPWLAAVRVQQALDAHLERGAALRQRLPRAVARLRARGGAAQQYRVASSAHAAVAGRAALDAGVSLAGWARAPAVGVDHALDASPARAGTACAGTIGRGAALAARALGVREQLERTAFIQVA